MKKTTKRLALNREPIHNLSLAAGGSFVTFEDCTFPCATNGQYCTSLNCPYTDNPSTHTKDRGCA